MSDTPPVLNPPPFGYNGADSWPDDLFAATTDPGGDDA